MLLLTPKKKKLMRATNQGQNDATNDSVQEMLTIDENTLVILCLDDVHMHTTSENISAGEITIIQPK